MHGAASVQLRCLGDGGGDFSSSSNGNGINYYFGSSAMARLIAMPFDPSLIKCRLVGSTVALGEKIDLCVLGKAVSFVVEEVSLASGVMGKDEGRAVVHPRTVVELLREKNNNDLLDGVNNTDQDGKEGWLRSAKIPKMPGCSQTLRALCEFVKRGSRMHADGVFGVPRFLLLTGSRGSGKTFAVSNFLRWLKRNGSSRASVRRISAVELATIESPQRQEHLLHWSSDTKAVQNISIEDVRVLVIDDLFALCDINGRDGKEPAFNVPGVVSARTRIEKRITALRSLQNDGSDDRTRYELIVGVCESKAADLLPRGLKSSHQISVGVPTEGERTEIFHSLLSEKKTKANFQFSGDNYDDAPKRVLARRLGELTSGCLPGDILKICDSCSDPKMLLSAAASAVPQGLRGLDVKSPLDTEEGSTCTQLAAAWEHIGGYHEVKKRLDQLIRYQWLYPDAVKRIGVPITTGVLLSGPSGCGKTMFAEALARVCKCNFISIKASEVFSKYLGESERIVREIFSRARRSAPCIIFLDEIDAIASKRSPEDEGTDVSTRVLATLLNEMDGIGGQKSRVLVLAATSREHELDAALLRPGRLGSIVSIGLPTVDDRREVLRACTRSMPLATGFNAESLAIDQRLAYFSCADLKSLCIEACMLALRQCVQSGGKSSNVTLEHFEKALEKVAAEDQGNKE